MYKCQFWLPAIFIALAVLVTPTRGWAADKVNVNTASEAELQKVPGIGAATAKKIIAGRPYNTYKELESKTGLSAAIVDKFRANIVLRSAADEKKEEPKTAKPAETKAADKKDEKKEEPKPAKPAEAKAADTKAAAKPAETKAAETKAADAKSAEAKKDDKKDASPSTALVNLNTATATELESLPGVSASIAKKIIANRPYNTYKELETKAGLTAAAVEKFRDEVRLKVAADDKKEEPKSDKPAEAKAADTKPADTKAADTKAADTKAAETKKDDKKPATATTKPETPKASTTTKPEAPKATTTTKPEAPKTTTTTPPKTATKTEAPKTTTTPPKTTAKTEPPKATTTTKPEPPKTAPTTETPKAADTAKTEPAKTDAAKAEKLDLNTATADALDDLKGVGPAYAAKIVAGRPYKSVDDLEKVVGESLFEKIKDQVTVKVETKADDAKAPVVARTPPKKGMVWTNPDTKVYHKEGDQWYGKTKTGDWMTEADAIKKGYRVSK